MTTKTIDWSPEELASLELNHPEFTGRAPDGALYATITKAEAHRLVQRYGKMLNGPDPLPPTGDREQDVLRARYPSMFRPRAK